MLSLLRRLSETMFIDSHCHLDLPDYASDLDQVMQRARDVGISCMLTVATRIDNFERIVQLTERYNNVFCTVGLHPQETRESIIVNVEQLVELAKHPKVVGFGETGLDYSRSYNPRSYQEQNFRIHIKAARLTGLPVVIHSRDADHEMIAILKDEMTLCPFTGLLHCFSSGTALARTAVELGLFVSISGIITFRKTDLLAQIVTDLPNHHLLIETDAPFLAPIPKRGQRNEPSFITYTATKIALLKGMTVSEIAETTTKNFLGLFRKIDPISFVNK